MAETLKAAVIGSGFGGLSAAVKLAAAGVDTTIYEARDRPGGRAYVYERDGFTFDGGPTVITAPECLAEVFAAAGVDMRDRVELIDVHPFYRLLFASGEAFDYSADLAGEIRRRYPDDLDGYHRFVDYSRRVFEAGYEGLVDKPFLRFTDMVRVAPQLAALRADRSVYATVARFVKSEHLRQALSFHSLLVGGNPFTTSSIYTLIHYLERKWGVSFPRGGTGALIRAMVSLFQECGGRIHLSAPVERAETVERAGRTRHRIHARGVEAAEYDFVVSNADLHHLYGKLYRGEAGAARVARRLERAKWSMSLFVLYFGTDRSYRHDVAHHTVLFGPRYRELLDDIFAGSDVATDFSLYLHSPTVTDPSLAPPGCGTFYVLSPVPHLGNAPVDWNRIGPEYAERILCYLESVLPDLRKHVVCKHWLTPLGFRDELRSHLGSAFSLAPVLTQSAYFRAHNRDDRIPGLYVVGAGTHPGAGVPGVVNSAKATARVIAEDFDLPALDPDVERPQVLDLHGQRVSA